MDHIERFYATIERKVVDKPASWLGMPVQGADINLCRYFNVGDMYEVKKILDDDIYHIDLPYHSPTSNAIYTALSFTKAGISDEFDHRTLTAPGFFEDFSDPDDVNKFDWPNPAKYIDRDLCKKNIEQVPKGYAILGSVWSCHFQDAWSAFGMETALVKMMTEPEIFRAVTERITEFYLQANEIFYEATKGKLHAVLMGNDYGCQTGLMLSPSSIKEFAMPGTKRLVEQAKSYGLKVIHHSCGAISEIIPDLIEVGVDAIHPIQALATGMSAQKLKMDFGNRISFCGGVDAQYLLVNGKPEQVREKVLELKSLFPTGLIVSPSHEAILPDVNPENIDTLFKTLK